MRLAVAMPDLDGARPAAAWSLTQRWARLVAERGIDRLWLGRGGADPLVFGAALVRTVPEVAVGLRLCPGERPPVVEAKALAALSLLGRGRSILVALEPAPGHLRRRAGEHLAVLRGLERGGPLFFDGDFLNLNGARNRPPPRPCGVGLWASGEASGDLFEMVVDHADGWWATEVDGAGPLVYRRQLRELEAHCQHAGRDSHSISRAVSLALGPSISPLAAALADWAELGVSEAVAHVAGPVHEADLDRLVEAGTLAGVWQTSVHPS